VCHGKIHNLDFTNHGNLIKIALKKRKKSGEPLGRPRGTNPDKILKNHPDIHLCLLDKMTVRQIAKHTGKGASTVQRIKKILNENG
jgi:DNA invertase Pin-like site-specific DNA recombinase